mmetsp:Transcript_152830/g.267051  ORF Transcript_152830/g.267051 Transcript_152830/m.267051 type:complete len:225 (+) Transcript_152830:2974-3648(+)
MQELEETGLERVSQLLDLLLLLCLESLQRLDHFGNILLLVQGWKDGLAAGIAHELQGSLLLCLLLPLGHDRAEAVSEQARGDGENTDGKKGGDRRDHTARCCVVAQRILTAEVEKGDPGRTESGLKLGLDLLIRVEPLSEVHADGRDGPQDEPNHAKVEKQLLLHAEDVVKELKCAEEFVRLQDPEESQRPDECGRQEVHGNQQVNVERHYRGQVHEPKEGAGK